MKPTALELVEAVAQQSRQVKVLCELPEVMSRLQGSSVTLPLTNEESFLHSALSGVKKEEANRRRVTRALMSFH
jgi:hypothetical protein